MREDVESFFRAGATTVIIIAIIALAMNAIVIFPNITTVILGVVGLILCLVALFSCVRAIRYLIRCSTESKSSKRRGRLFHVHYEDGILTAEHVKVGRVTKVRKLTMSDDGPLDYFSGTADCGQDKLDDIVVEAKSKELYLP